MAYINLTLPDGEEICQGKQVTFVAPCDCSTASGIKVGGKTFTIVDALGQAAVGSGKGSFCSGALVNVVLDVTNLKAYLQNSATCANSLKVNGLSFSVVNGILTITY